MQASETHHARPRYRIAFFALGWLIAIGILFHGIASNTIRRGYDGLADRLLRVGQSMSDAEGNAWQRTHHDSRRDAVMAEAPKLMSRAWLARPDRMLYGAFDGGLPQSFNGIDALESQLHYRFPIISIYQAWGDRPDEAEFPLLAVSTVDRLGSVPMITWEPWD